MKPTICVAALAIIALAAGPALSQVPAVTAYFDPDLTDRSMDCPGPVTGSVYVCAEGFDMMLAGVEFKVDYPPSMAWLADLGTPPVTIGTSASGVSMGWGMPQNGYDAVLCLQALVLWNCTDCSVVNEPLSVVPHPLFGEVRATRFPDYAFVPAVGNTSTICQRVYMDIKPKSCPNPFNMKLFEWANDKKPRKGGVLPVAILGSETVDVTQIDVTTLRLEGVPPVEQGAGPQYADVGAPPPMDGGDCVCPDPMADGYMDLTMRFRAQDIARALGSPHASGKLTLKGEMLDGTPFDATDCVQLVGGGKDLPDVIEQVVLHGASPNPFNPSTRIAFDLPEAAHVHLAVYDVAGRRVSVLVNGPRTAGPHVVDWAADGMATWIDRHEQERACPYGGSWLRAPCWWFPPTSLRRFCRTMPTSPSATPRTSLRGTV